MSTESEQCKERDFYETGDLQSTSDMNFLKLGSWRDVENEAIRVCKRKIQIWEANDQSR